MSKLLNNLKKINHSAIPLWVVALSLFTSHSTFALPPTTQLGTPVKKIVTASAIQGWQTLDNQRLILQISASRQYLVTLTKACHGLGWAESIGVSMSNNTVWAGFDYVSADGRKCHIQSISKLTKAEAHLVGS